MDYSMTPRVSRTTPLLLALWGLVWLTFSSPARAQSGETDTLYYFHPNGLSAAYISYIGDVLDLGVYFEVDTSWDYFDITQLHFLFFPYLSPLPHSESVLVYQSDSLPESVLDTVTFTIDDSTDLSPHWKIVDLSGYHSLGGLSTGFWVTGSALFSVLPDTLASSGHGIWYSQINDSWSHAGDRAIRAVVVKRETVGITRYGASNTSPGSEISISKIFPNPFNSYTTLEIQFPGGATKGRASFQIVDMRGKVIHSIALNGINPEGFRFRWNGLDSNGNATPSGIYLARLQYGGQAVSRKMILLK